LSSFISKLPACCGIVAKPDFYAWCARITEVSEMQRTEIDRQEFEDIKVEIRDLVETVTTHMTLISCRPSITATCC
jgi:hypothetical protein